MSKHVWKVGDACFIVQMHLHPPSMRMQILPATVVQVFDAAHRQARAVAYTEAIAGPQMAEGEPFATDIEAANWLKEYATKVCSAAGAAVVYGRRPEWKLPDNAPVQGDVMYTVDYVHRELLEVVIGIVRIEHGKMEVGYDTSPGSPEADMVCLKQWWPTREAAEAYLREHDIDITFKFVSKEELARRVNAEVDKVWTDAESRARSPEFQESLRALFGGFTHL